MHDLSTYEDPRQYRGIEHFVVNDGCPQRRSLARAISRAGGVRAAVLRLRDGGTGALALYLGPPVLVSDVIRARTAPRASRIAGSGSEAAAVFRTARGGIRLVRPPCPGDAATTVRWGFARIVVWHRPPYCSSRSRWRVGTCYSGAAADLSPPADAYYRSFRLHSPHPTFPYASRSLELGRRSLRPPCLAASLAAAAANGTSLAVHAHAVAVGRTRGGAVRPRQLRRAMRRASGYTLRVKTAQPRVSVRDRATCYPPLWCRLRDRDHLSIDTAMNAWYRRRDRLPAHAGRDDGIFRRRASGSGIARELGPALPRGLRPDRCHRSLLLPRGFGGGQVLWAVIVGSHDFTTPAPGAARAPCGVGPLGPPVHTRWSRPPPVCLNLRPVRDCAGGSSGCLRRHAVPG